MLTAPKIPDYVHVALEEYQITLGGIFNRQGIIHPRIYGSTKYFVERIDNERKRTWLIIASYGYILVHKHEKVSENFKILQLFDGAYGHLFYPKHNRQALEGLVGKSICFQKGEFHGLHLAVGHAIIQIEITGEFDPDDVYIH
jgi:hypothetical protein